MTMSQSLIDDVLTSETEVNELFSQDIPKGIVMEVTQEGYVVKDVWIQELLLVTASDFNYQVACQLFKMAEEDESIWVIGYDPVTKVHQEF